MCRARIINLNERRRPSIILNSLLVMLAIIPIYQLHSLAIMQIPVLFGQKLIKYFPDSESHSSILKVCMSFEMLAYILIIILSVALMKLLLQRKSAFIKFAVVYFSICLLVSVTDFIQIGYLLNADVALLPWYTRPVAASVIFFIVYVPFVLRSRKIRAMFVK